VIDQVKKKDDLPLCEECRHPIDKCICGAWTYFEENDDEDEDEDEEDEE
jgi:hypothetical protein